MYYPDLTPYTYMAEAGLPISDDLPHALNIGWLDNVHDYAKGEVTSSLIERLRLFCRTPVNNTRGFHECPFCNADPRSYLVIGEGDNQIGMGSGEIWVFGSDECTYAAPTLIYHYVVNHHYQPPQVFVQAVLESPLPKTAAYDERAGKFEWGQDMLRRKKFRLD